MQLSILFDEIGDYSYTKLKENINPKWIFTEYNEYNLTTIHTNNKLPIFKHITFGKISNIVIDQIESKIIAFEIPNNTINNKIGESIDWNNTIITPIRTGTIDVCLFNYHDEWFLFFTHLVIKLNNTELLNNKIHNLFNLAISPYLETLNKSSVYHISLFHDSLKKFGIIDNTICPSICLITVYNNNTNIECTIPIEQNYKISSYQELLSLTDIMNQDTIHKKTIEHIGYKICTQINNDINYYTIKTPIYRELEKLFDINTNVHKVFIELYKKDILTLYSHYLHKYPFDILKRLNTVFKVCSQELTNIYHITRNKKNSDIYDILSNVYKKILYDLHNMYVNSGIDNKKKSITWVDVYKYLKYNNVDIIELLNDRMKLIQIIEQLGLSIRINNVIYSDCIDIITLLALV
jgi:hypothetical protein